ncbi:uncharacterized protein BX664DRAFT_295635 [Halteromyces radiatus]|uniref:uncharacterized protein n=1 Tax=Halteromyces radiatus TaxID=101107 RepID=UPI00221EBFB1|nr:uncharacterized protein BX664DRAFT_295635 [Halteromyces radiatus]KAI8093728.1 hypothetical protein BX664DRAFT_295635 [Halteromyces radiatus]
MRPTTSGQLLLFERLAKGNWTNIGYIRKSPGQEPVETRKRLIEAMADRLKKQCLCKKTFVSDGTRSSDPILSRDVGSTRSHCNGNTQDMFAYISSATKNVRLCVIDYAGISTNPEDIKKTMRLVRNIKELEILHKSNVEAINRHELKTDKTLIKFQCRTGPVHRSK